MELFSEKQCDFMADHTARERAVKDSIRDGKSVVRVYKMHMLTLIVDDDIGERLNKNFYDIIDLQGNLHMVPGFTYETIGDDQFQAMVEKLMAGEEL